jgi:hypothetical protein
VSQDSSSKLSKEQQTHAQKLEDPRLYILKYLDEAGIKVDERGEIIDARNLNALQLFNTLYLDYLEEVKEFNKGVYLLNRDLKADRKTPLIKAIAEKNLERALFEHINNIKIEFRFNLINRFKCDAENLGPVYDFVKALTGTESPADACVMAHWMWQVKKKMKNETPSYHIMPIFFGKQEGGKTVALNKLIGPINNFRLNINLDQMGDDRYFRAMSENFVIVFDEMQGAHRTDIDALKKQVTIDFNDYRPLGTNEIFKVRQACSFIGATNRPVSEQIVDSTGMRRFWQLNCMDRLDWATLNALDYIAMWKGIDEARVDGYILKHIDSIREVQNEMVAIDVLQLYLNTKHLLDTKGPFKRVTTSEMYQDFKTWALDNGHRLMDSSWFGRRLSNRGLKSKQTSYKKISYNYYEIPVHSNVAQSIVFDASEQYTHITVADSEDTSKVGTE